jgi:hypothetical protein
MRALQLLSVSWWILHAATSPLQDERQVVFASPDTSSRVGIKRVAIVGAGTAGVSTLKTLLVDIPENLRRGWEVVVFEQRADVGGIWYVLSQFVLVHSSYALQASRSQPCASTTRVTRDTTLPRVEDKYTSSN